MAFKLSKTELAEKLHHIEALEKAHTALSDAVAVFNVAVQTQRELLEEAIVGYGDAIGEAKGWAEEIAADIQCEFDDKSEKWQEGDRGQAAAEWIAAWEGFDPEDAEIEIPEEIEFDVDPAHEVLADLPDEVEA